MRKASSDEISLELEPIILANVPPKDFAHLFPIEMCEIDQFAAPEPSIGAVIQLNNGQYIGVNYGKISNTLMIRIPPSSDTKTALQKHIR